MLIYMPLTLCNGPQTALYAHADLQAWPCTWFPWQEALAFTRWLEATHTWGLNDINLIDSKIHVYCWCLICSPTFRILQRWFKEVKEKQCLTLEGIMFNNVFLCHPCSLLPALQRLNSNLNQELHVKNTQMVDVLFIDMYQQHFQNTQTTITNYFCLVIQEYILPFTGNSGRWRKYTYLWYITAMCISQQTSYYQRQCRLKTKQLQYTMTLVS